MTDGSALGHVTVLLHEAVDGLAVKPDGVYVDGTFGRGGHSRLILSKLGENGRLFAFDKDPQAIATAEKLGDARFTIVHQGFASLQRELQARGVACVDGILLDLGISSPQIDEAERGEGRCRRAADARPAMHDHGAFATPLLGEADELAHVRHIRRDVVEDGLGDIVHLEPQMSRWRDALRRGDRDFGLQQGDEAAGLHLGDEVRHLAQRADMHGAGFAGSGRRRVARDLFGRENAGHGLVHWLCAAGVPLPARRPHGLDEITVAAGVLSCPSSISRKRLEALQEFLLRLGRGPGGQAIQV